MRIGGWLEGTVAQQIARVILGGALFMLALSVGIGLSGTRMGSDNDSQPALERIDDMVRMIEAAPAANRVAMLKAVSQSAFIRRADWYSAASAVAATLNVVARQRYGSDMDSWPRSANHPRPRLSFTPDSALFRTLGFDPAKDRHGDFIAVRLSDSGWVIFSTAREAGRPALYVTIGLQLMLLVLAISATATIAATRLSQPIRQFTDALRQFCVDPKAPPIPETGPRELRAAIAAFNGLRARLHAFVEDRTTMLAAISHDLRTPLTKIRLRGELIEDESLRVQLFHDVDDVIAMTESALALFRDEYQTEDITAFDFPALVRTIVDDFNDQGTPVVYTGPERVAFRGRPFALKRVCANLIGNAVKYGAQQEVELQCSKQGVALFVRDRGPGIPPAELEKVFAPFYRAERSRNSAAKGMGIGLTSARAVARAHGGDVTLANRADGGLETRMILPVIGQRMAV